MTTYILSNLYYNARIVLNKVLFSVPLILTNKQGLYNCGLNLKVPASIKRKGNKHNFFYNITHTA